MDEQELNDQELIDLLGELETPEIPTALAERINHALAVEAAARQAPATAGDATATNAATGATAPTLDELAQRRAAAGNAGSAAGAPRSSRRTKVLGAVAGIAAVGVLGVVGVQTLGSNHPGDLSAGNGAATNQPTDAVGGSGAAGPGASQVSYAETPVIATGTTFTQASLAAQVEQQLPKWQRASQLVQVSPNAINDIDLDGTADPTTGAAASRTKVVTSLRDRLSDCLANIDRENVTPLVVDLAELRDGSNANPQNVAVVALPQDQGAPQESASYEVYFVGANCNRQNTDVVAQLTVASDGSN